MTPVMSGVGYRATPSWRARHTGYFGRTAPNWSIWPRRATLCGTKAQVRCRLSWRSLTTLQNSRGKSWHFQSSQISSPPPLSCHS